MSVENNKVAIVGGGMAGVIAARELLVAGAVPTIFEKSRGLGGRLATRRMNGGFSADHGAQFLSAEKPPFLEFLSETARSGAIAEWDTASSDANWYVGVPAMNSFLKSEPLGFDLKTSTQIIKVTAHEDGVELTMLDGSAETFDQVIITAPAPQAVAMLNGAQTDMAAELSAVEIAPNWTLMLVFAERLAPGFAFWSEDHPTLGWIGRNSSKPGRAFSQDSWTVQASVDWSTKFLELEKEEAGERLFNAFRDLIGSDLPSPIVQTAHRWRYARTLKPLGKPFLADAEGRIYLAGDWCLGAGVECAFDSGLAAARDIIAKAG